MRKTTILLLLLTLLWQCLPAQTQQGHVRTLGRPDKKSKALKGVTIRVKGQHNPVLSDSIGSFSLLMTGLKNGDAYTLQQVQKSGYELNETSLIGQQQAFSDKVPLEIVMVSLNQLQADKQRIENNAYKAAEKNFNAKLKQLEEQFNSNSISIEKYQEEQRRPLSTASPSIMPIPTSICWTKTNAKSIYALRMAIWSGQILSSIVSSTLSMCCNATWMPLLRSKNNWLKPKA